MSNARGSIVFNSELAKDFTLHLWTFCDKQNVKLTILCTACNGLAWHSCLVQTYCHSMRGSFFSSSRIFPPLQERTDTQASAPDYEHDNQDGSFPLHRQTNRHLENGHYKADAQLVNAVAPHYAEEFQICISLHTLQLCSSLVL